MSFNNKTDTIDEQRFKPKICKKEVIVVTAPFSPYPDFSTYNNKSTSNTSYRQHPGSTKEKKELSIIDIQNEINNFIDNNQVFESKRAFKKANKKSKIKHFMELTGRSKPPKQHQVPLPILRGIRKKVKIREEHQKKESLESHVVSHLMQEVMKKRKKKQTKKNDKRKKYRDLVKEKRSGPTPGIGFLKAGILRVNSKIIGK